MNYICGKLPIGYIKRAFREVSNRRSISFSARALSTESNEGPLSNIRVLDLTRIVAGPYCTMLLGDLGAEIIKVERLNTGDESRKWGPPFMSNSTDSCYFMANNRNKKSVCINLKSDNGKRIIYDLAKRSDVFIENYIPGKLESMNLGYNDLKKVNPKIIYCSLTGYGPTGPYAERPGYDVIAASMGGLVHITGPENGEPAKVGVAVTDLATGLFAHGAIMAALIKRQKTNRGQKIDCNLFSTQVAMLNHAASNYLNAGVEMNRMGTAHGSIVPYEAFPTKTGYITIGAGSNEQFISLCKIIKMEELSADPRFATNSLRVENRDKIIPILRKVFESKTSEEWLSILEKAPFPYGPINNIKEVFDDRHIKAIGIVKDLPHATYGSVRVVGPPVVYSDGGNVAKSAPPTLGQHTAEILRDVIDYGEDTIKELIKKGDIQ